MKKMVSRVAFVPVAALVASLPACGEGPHRQALPPASVAAGPVLFTYETIDGRALSTESLANRISVIAFLATYDVHSQAEARLLASLRRHHSPRLNVAALVLEPPENRPLVEAFASSLGLDYPIALADAATIAGEGPFANLHHVPSVVVLDRAGHEVWRHVGFVSEAGLEAAVREVEARSPPPHEVDVDDGGATGR
jgi:hypothetical protein